MVEILPSLEGEAVSGRRAEPGETLTESVADDFRPARGDGWVELKTEEPGEHQVADPFLSQPVADTAPPVEAFAPGAAVTEPVETEDKPTKLPATLWSWGLALAGAILFGVGLVWVYNGRAGAGAPIGVGLAVGVVGLVCLSIAGYFLLDRLGARQDTD